MCFVEYVGYTCGHTSLPVVRPCPMTTQMHTNPTCPRPACRPMLPPSMCPSCGRILHGRFVDIIEHEHRFMHERGACSCDIRFPHLQQPRMVAPTGVGLGVTAPPATVHMDGSQFAFSPSAAAFTPRPSPASIAASLPSSMANISISASSDDVRSATSEFTTRRAGKGKQQHQHWKGKGRGRGRGRGQYPNNRQQRRRASTSTTTTTPRHGQGLPPLFEGGEHQHHYQHHHEAASSSSRRVSVSVRMLSLYGAEWTRDHAELHRAGRCACDITFDRYTGHPELPSEGAAFASAAFSAATTAATNTSVSNGSNGSSGSSTTLIQYGENASQSESVSVSVSANAYTMPTYAYDSNAGASTSSYQSPQASGYASSFEPSADQTTTTAQHQQQHPYLHISDTVHRYWTPYIAPPIAPGQPARWVCNPYDTSAMSGNNNGQAPEQEQHGYNNNASSASSGMPIFPNITLGHPIDMQTIYYEPQGTPIVGLPIGAGPEGDSHAPPFEDCELYYPKLAPHQRPASR
ncbi:hypothetical protein F4774DRAFT_426341 [Daldinia eschscholtzii]|nr:hypothetical protein F4774DRAFT_426341 [Daldinia eschscholtzii]